MRVVTLQNEMPGLWVLVCLATNGEKEVPVGISCDGFLSGLSEFTTSEHFLSRERYGRLYELDSRSDYRYCWLRPVHNLPCATNEHRLRLLLGETVQVGGGWTVSPL